VADQTPRPPAGQKGRQMTKMKLANKFLHPLPPLVTEQDKYEQIMEGDLTTMSDTEVARAVEVLLNRYIPNMVASLAHPDSIALYRLRAIAAMEECVLRQDRAIHG